MKKTAETTIARSDTIAARQHRTKRRYFAAVLALALCAAMTCSAFAAGDPLTIINNLSEDVWCKG